MGNKKFICLIIILLLVMIVVLGAFVYKILNSKNEKDKSENGRLEISESINKVEANEEDENKKIINIFNGNDRPIAVMIDNHKGAWPQAGLNDAYLVYEIIVEGGETRLMALFKGVNIENIGPVRSSRHYFLDYVLENDAIYVHYGWSPQAQSDISDLEVNNINGITESSKNFWRTNKKSSPHNVLTNISNILSISDRKGYVTTSNTKSVLNYSADEINLEEGEDATLITIPHSKMQIVEYKYDDETQRYIRYARNKLQSDFISGEPVTVKNIIITMCDNYTLDDPENKGRQGLKNIGKFDGYYITNGKAIKIKCIKTDRKEQTLYKTLDGEEIKVNDGNTFINICPTNSEVIISDN